jgi:putative peptidoglycan lipid II flippase
MLALGAVYAGSRGLGLVREVGVAYYFGTSATADRWAAAFVVVSLASVATSEATYAAAVRWLGERGGTTPGPDADRAFANLFRAVGRAALSVSAVYAVVAPIATLLVLGDFGMGALQAVLLSISLAPTVAANMLASCVNARLTFERRFILMNAAQTLYSLGAILGIAVVYFAGPSIGPEPIALGWSLGNIGALAVVYFAAKPRTLHTTGRLNVMSDLLHIGGPIAIAYSLVSVQGLTDQAVAGRLGTGSVAALSYSNRLFLLPVGFVLGTLGPIVLGALTSSRSLGRAAVARSAGDQLALLTRVIAPLSVFFSGAVPLLVVHVYQYGAFATSSSVTTIAALDGFSVGVSAVALYLIYFRAMQAIAQLRAIVVIAALSTALNAILSILFAVAFGIYGDTVATSLTAFITMQFQIRALGRELGNVWQHEVSRTTTVPVVVACVISLGLTTAMRAHVFTDTGGLAIGGALGGTLWLLLVLRGR